jgi:hypothetical protein
MIRGDIRICPPNMAGYLRDEIGFAWEGVVDALGLDPRNCPRDHESPNRLSHAPGRPSWRLPVDLSDTGPLM